MISTRIILRPRFVYRYPIVSFYIMAVALGAGTVFLVIKGMLPTSLALISVLSASIAGIMMTTVEDSRAGLKLMLSRLLIWRVEVRFWIFKISFPFNLSHIAIANGATFCARYTVYEFLQLSKAIARGMNHQGFSFIEVISNCHVNFGRRNNLGDSIAMRQMFKKARVRMSEKDIGLDYHKTDIEYEVGVGFTKIPTGIFLEERENPEEFSERIVDAYEFKK